MKKEVSEERCLEEKDFLNHFLNEQITQICVEEEVERMRDQVDE
ncbi:hypothetical protein [Bacillus weihaiensis]|nr:hypothetical protein [Bacillus weihaiensis]